MSVTELYIQQGIARESYNTIAQKISNSNIKINYLSRESMDSLCDTSNHQGLAARIKEFRYADIQQIINRRTDHSSSLVVILDHIEDPQNLGAILRTCGFFMVSGVIIPVDRSVSVTPAVIKVSAGAALSVPVARVVNLSDTIRLLKKKGYWIVGTDNDSSSSIRDLDVSGLDIALVLGNESRGIGKKIMKNCDFIVRIPTKGMADSLNVSVAAGIAVYEMCIKAGRI